MTNPKAKLTLRPNRGILRSGYKESTESRTEGVAKTGQISKKGTVTHTEHWDGSIDAKVRPATVKAKMGLKR